MRYSITILFLCFANFLFACDCIITPIERHIKETKYVITGQVIALLDTDKEKAKYSIYPIGDRAYRVKVKIQNSFKGKLLNEQTIELDSRFKNCDMYFTKNESYLLFLHKIKGKYYVKHCSYNETIKNSRTNIIKVKQLTKINGS